MSEIDGQQDDAETEGTAALLGRGGAAAPIAASSTGETRATHSGNPQLDGNGSPPVRNEDDGDLPPIDEARVMARIRDFYREMLEAPVPDEMMRRMRALEEKEGQK
jgi:hypothetical protein